MDAPALSAFMAREFSQVADDFELGEVTPQGLRLWLKASEKHLRPGGTVSGPAMFALADIAVYLAILSRIGPVALAVTTSCSIDFMRKPAAGHAVCADVRLLKLGRSLAVADLLIYSESEADPVARASMTYAIPPSR
ncbi:PaaI family thioesterase [Pseudogemmobacter sp. CC-YST710]|uniref:PaaI family thioesterase n=2 Tax=Pseudogemmobacter faecipullorum TaxID=2755041 RepID=A0ABS8CP82_9RHOB|nr:PaaI family thioesterase [Pseudogemmobacter faecipullorum]